MFVLVRPTGLGCLQPVNQNEFDTFDLQGSFDFKDKANSAEDSQ